MSDDNSDRQPTLKPEKILIPRYLFDNGTHRKNSNGGNRVLDYWIQKFDKKRYLMTVTTTNTRKWQNWQTEQIFRYRYADLKSSAFFRSWRFRLAAPATFRLLNTAGSRLAAQQYISRPRGNMFHLHNNTFLFSCYLDRKDILWFQQITQTELHCKYCFQCLSFAVWFVIKRTWPNTCWWFFMNSNQQY